MINIAYGVMMILLVTQSPRQEIDRVAYDDFLSLHFAEIFPKFALKISKEFNIDQGRVLEIAFTAPYLAIELAAVSTARFEVLVTDSIEANICTKRIEESGLSDRFSIYIGTVDSLPFSDTAFALVIAREAMRFWQTNEKAYHEINRVLKNDGSALLGAGFTVAINEEEAGRLWTVVQQWRLDSGCEPWVATKPVPDEIEKTLLGTGIYNYSMVVEGDCTCRTMIQWQKIVRDNQK